MFFGFGIRSAVAISPRKAVFRGAIAPGVAPEFCDFQQLFEGTSDAESGSAVRSRFPFGALRLAHLPALRRRGSAASANRVTACGAAGHERFGARSTARDAQRAQRRDRAPLFVLDVAGQCRAARPWTAAPQAKGATLTRGGAALAFSGVTPGRESSGARNASYASPERLRRQRPKDLDTVVTLGDHAPFEVRTPDLDVEIEVLQGLQPFGGQALHDAAAEDAVPFAVASAFYEHKVVEREAGFAAEDFGHVSAAYHGRRQPE